MIFLEKLFNQEKLNKEDFEHLINNYNKYSDEAAEMARKIHIKNYGKTLYFRALIEISSYCKRNCYYCGLRASNINAVRYRLSELEILNSAAAAYNAGFRTIVMQGGEDPEIIDEFIVSIIKKLKNNYPDIAITISLGEKSYKSYEMFKNAGADRYLLRHETINNEHYSKLHPENMHLNNRIDCLRNLKKLGFQVGAGMMVGSPFQTNSNLAEDLMFIQDFMPHMIGIGPFIHHKDTPFKDFDNGDTDKTYFILSLARLIDQRALIPITTALSTLDNNALKKGLLSGGNVIMPNVSPKELRKNYSIYNNKKDYQIENKENLIKIKELVKSLGYEPDMQIGNYK